MFSRSQEGPEDVSTNNSGDLSRNGGFTIENAGFYQQPLLVGGLNPSEKYWSIGMIIPNIWENKKCSKPPTSLSFFDQFLDAWHSNVGILCQAWSVYPNLGSPWISPLVATPPFEKTSLNPPLLGNCRWNPTGIHPHPWLVKDPVRMNPIFAAPDPLFFLKPGKWKKKWKKKWDQNGTGTTTTGEIRSP